MKAQLESRKSVRLNWFKQEKVPFSIKNILEWQYSRHSAEQNEILREVLMQYEFSQLEKPIPNTDIIIFDKTGLPQAYMNTEKNIGKKFLTNKVPNREISVKDRLVSLKKGENKVTSKPVPPQEAHRYKEIQEHERIDVIQRKISVTNESSRDMKEIRLEFIQTKEVEFLSCKPETSGSSPPEYFWKVDIPAESTTSIEINLNVITKSVYKIEKEKIVEKIQPNIQYQR
ncbi:hypothetical protein NEF87_003448 [Candidatus Lokiarchaeum ossiferum]|uniref:DUF4139 domain-containing protein n=1 Tax=Candidatus Lokiarchaeum ossiferum TaxID=2951803 RepID=A0ABY6HUZ0_9ARCH|nr:hypothetical protein NEF87_003448 [Candidatus Lokiarchaeum sp. B-35]